MMTTAELFHLVPNHRPRFVEFRLVCRCGESLCRGRGTAARARELRAHLFRVLNADRDAERARIRGEWQEVVTAVERDRLDIVARGLTLAQFAFACGVARTVARQWLQRRGLDWARNKRAVAA
jgi:hypothetical protein